MPIRAAVVECSLRLLDIWSCSREATSANSDICVATNFSNTLDRTGRIEIGRNCLPDIGLFSLGTGDTRNFSRFRKI